VQRFTVASSAVILGLTASLASSGDRSRSHKDSLKLRASPAVAVTPARIMFTGFLERDRDLGRYSCPEVEWRWGDGERSIRTPDCESPDDDDAFYDRLWSARHNYSREGTYEVALILRRDGRAVAYATTTVILH
jgi:hypothetical protein